MVRRARPDGCLVGGLAWQEGDVALGHDKSPRQQDDRGRAAVARDAQRDPDAVPGGQPADDEEAELVAVGRVELRRLGQPLVQRVERVGRDAEAAVFDLEGVPVADPAAPDLHEGARRRVLDGVLDELGEHVGHVGDGRALHEVG